jgi:glyoxylate utilization-related uncharacterized protein
MSFFRWLAGHRAYARARTSRSKQAQLALEVLEDRALLTLITPALNPALGDAGYHVEFRKAGFALNNQLVNADMLFSLPTTDSRVVAQAFDNGVSVLNYLDTGGGSLFANPRDVSTQGGGFGGGFIADPVFGSFNGPNQEDDNFAMKASGYLYIPQAGSWTFTVRSDDGFRLVMGDNNAVVSIFDGGRFPGSTTGVAEVPVAGYYHFTLTWDQSILGAMLEFSAHGPGQSTDLLVGDPSGALRLFQALPQSITPFAGTPDLSQSGNTVEFRKAGFALNNTLAQSDYLFGLSASDAQVTAQAFDNGVATINYLDSGSTQYLFPNPRDVGTPTLNTVKGTFLANAEDDNFAMKASGFIYIPQAGTWAFTVASDDDFRLRMGEGDNLVGEFQGGRYLAPTTMYVDVATAGYYRYDLTWDQSILGAACAFSAHGPGQSTDMLVGDPNGTLRVYQSPRQTITPADESVAGAAGSSVEFRKANFSNVALVNADTLFGLAANDPNVLARALDNGVGTINYLDTGSSLFANARDVSSSGGTFGSAGAFGGGFLARTLSGSFAGPNAEDDNFAMKASGFIYIPAAGTWNFTVASDDGFRLEMGDNAALVAEFDGGRALAPTTGSVEVATPGYYRYNLTWFQGSGSAGAELYANGPGQPNNVLVGDPSGVLKVVQMLATPAAAMIAHQGNISGTLATFRDDNLLSTANDFVATVNWGDGSSSSETITQVAPGLFTVKGAHTYTAGGDMNVVVNIADADGTKSVQVETTVTVGQPTSMVVTADTGATTAGDSVNVTVTILDQFGQIVPFYTGTVHFTSTDSQAVLPGDYTFTSADQGMHVFSVTLKTAGSQTITATDTQISTLSGNTSITVTPGAASSFIVSAPANAQAGSPINVTVTARDAFGNTATGYTGTVHFTSSDAAAVLPSDYTFTAADAGVHTFAVTFQTAGTQSLMIADTANATLNASVSVAVAAPLIDPVAIQPGQTATIGFWLSRRGRELICSFNGGPNSTALANWLAQTFPNLYGSLSGKTNDYIVRYFRSLFHGPGRKLDAQILTTALNVYATTRSLGGDAGKRFGFLVTAGGLGASTFGLGMDGSAFGVANNTHLTVMQILQKANEEWTVRGLLGSRNANLAKMAFFVFRDINHAGLRRGDADDC